MPLLEKRINVPIFVPVHGFDNTISTRTCNLVMHCNILEKYLDVIAVKHNSLSYKSICQIPAPVVDCCKNLFNWAMWLKGACKWSLGLFTILILR